MERRFEEEGEIKECETCRGPIAVKRDWDGILYIIPIEHRYMRSEYENDALRSKLSSAEKIIIMLREKLRDYEAR